MIGGLGDAGRDAHAAARGAANRVHRRGPAGQAGDQMALELLVPPQLRLQPQLTAAERGYGQRRQDSLCGQPLALPGHRLELPGHLAVVNRTPGDDPPP